MLINVTQHDTIKMLLPTMQIVTQTTIICMIPVYVTFHCDQSKICYIFFGTGSVAFVSGLGPIPYSIQHCDWSFHRRLARGPSHICSTIVSIAASFVISWFLLEAKKLLVRQRSQVHRSMVQQAPFDLDLRPSNATGWQGWIYRPSYPAATRQVFYYLRSGQKLYQARLVQNTIHLRTTITDRREQKFMDPPAMAERRRCGGGVATT